MMITSQSGWRPIFDVRLDEHPETVQCDMSECKNLASQAADMTKEVAMGAGVGAVTVTVAAGAILAIPVGLWKDYEANEDFKRAFKTCMRQRGHKIVNY